MSQQRSAIERQIQKVRQNLSIGEEKRRAVAEEIRRKDAQKNEFHDRLEEQLHGQVFDEYLEKLSQDLKQKQDEKGNLVGMEKTYQKFLQQLRAKENVDPCCPLCYRKFEKLSESEQLIRDIESMIKGPEYRRKIDRDFGDAAGEIREMSQLAADPRATVDLGNGRTAATEDANQRFGQTDRRFEERREKTGGKSERVAVRAVRTREDRCGDAGEIRQGTRRVPGENPRLSVENRSDGHERRSIVGRSEEEKRSNAERIRPVGRESARQTSTIAFATGSSSATSRIVDRTEKTKKLKLSSDVQKKERLDEQLQKLTSQIQTLKEDIEHDKHALDPLLSEIERKSKEKSRLVLEKDATIGRLTDSVSPFDPPPSPLHPLVSRSTHWNKNKPS